MPSVILRPGDGGGYLNNGVVHTHDQRNAKKRVVFFFRLNTIHANCD